MIVRTPDYRRANLGIRTPFHVCRLPFHDSRFTNKSHMYNKKIFLLVIVLFCKVAIIHAQDPTWTETASGVWKATAGVPESYDLLKASGATPNREAIAAITHATFPLSQPDISIKVVDGKTYLRFPLQKEEQLYGFGLNFQTVHQRGKILQLHVEDRK